MEKGIYTLANDKVYDQLVALLNSIEANCGREMPVCVIPYDDNTDLVQEEIAKRKNVFLFEQKYSIEKWENFVDKFHKIFLNYYIEGLQEKKHQVVNMHRKYCAFDGPFEKFVFIESDTLVFQPFNHVFSKLEEYDFVVHDFQRLTSIRRNTVKNYFPLFKDLYGSEDNLAKRFHCSGFWASKQGLFNEKNLDKILQELENGEIKVFRNTWLGEQSILNHITLKKNLHLYNFTLDENSEYSTGVCVTSKHFESKNHILYDGGKKLTYLHYMGVKNERLQQLCRWKKRNLPINNIFLALGDKVLKSQMKNIPYKEVFLYYRFMTEA